MILLFWPNIGWLCRPPSTLGLAQLTLRLRPHTVSAWCSWLAASSAACLSTYSTKAHLEARCRWKEAICPKG
jgi:hypothetical protein